MKVSDFRQIFEAYGGDYTATIKRFVGNEKMYLRILNMLFANENLQNLQDSVEQEDWDGAFAAAHTLKGVTGNLGLQPLYAAVCAIVEPLRSKEKADYRTLYANIAAEFSRAERLRDALRGGI